VPELPEVETIRRRLASLVEGRTFAEVEIADPRLTRPVDPGAVGQELQGERVRSLGRRGKYLLFGFESGRVLLVHLRMTGTFRYAGAGARDAEPPYRRAVVSMDDGSDIAFHDVRRFGTWLLLEPEEVEGYLALRLGPEPLEDAFTVEHLRGRLRGRRAPLKAAILDQRTVAGLGNIYADEALWRARLHPRRPAGTLGRPQLELLRESVRESLRVGIERQGSTLRNYRTPDGETGSMQDEFRVYGRLGEPCERCGTPIERIVVAGRGTWYCPRCQRLRASGSR
jgi:formamidopyrimidine-DNA glycosylase